MTLLKLLKTNLLQCLQIQLAVVVEYVECNSAESLDSSIECFGYNTKQSDSEAPVLEF